MHRHHLEKETEKAESPEHQHSDKALVSAGEEKIRTKPKTFCEMLKWGQKLLGEIEKQSWQQRGKGGKTLYNISNKSGSEIRVLVPLPSGEAERSTGSESGAWGADGPAAAQRWSKRCPRGSFSKRLREKSHSPGPGTKHAAGAAKPCVPRACLGCESPAR